jgi:type I restriction enzyme S subunit
MKSNYRKIGDFINLLDERNNGLKVTNLVGLSISKQFIKSVANTIGTDMENYKIIRKNQFACSTMQVRRDKKMPLALYTENEPAIISQAYPVFEINDTSQLLPEYLMMWFTRSEFDREACFHAVGGVRGSLEWEDFCGMQLPIPSIEKQQEIVREYNTIQNRIALNNQLIQKLEETAQAIYKQWFVDFEFPDENGKPYKSNGGKMVWCEELEREIPEGWKVGNLTTIANYKNGLAMQKFEPIEGEDYLPVIKIRELNIGKTDANSNRCIKEIPDEIFIRNGDVIFSWSGSLLVDIWVGGYGGLNQHLFKVTSKKVEKWFYYLATKFHLEEFIRIADGNKTSLGHIKKEHLENAAVFLPIKEQLIFMNKIMRNLIENLISTKLENQKLEELKELLLAKMTRVEEIKEHKNHKNCFHKL